VRASADQHEAVVAERCGAVGGEQLARQTCEVLQGQRSQGRGAHGDRWATGGGVGLDHRQPLAAGAVAELVRNHLRRVALVRSGVHADRHDEGRRGN
jgi:hypothetical protein